MHRTASLAVAPLIALVLVLAACGEEGEPTAGEEAPPATEPVETAAEPAEPGPEAPSFELRIGATLPLSGDLASFGPPFEAAIRIAADQINEALEAEGLAEAISVNIVAIEDDQTEAAAAVEAATKLVQTDDIDLLIGTMSSTSTIPVAQSVTIPNGVLQIPPTPSAPTITDLEDDDLVWRILSSDTLQARVLVEAVEQTLGEGATVNVGARNDAFGTALKDLFERDWMEAGGEIGVSLTWNPEAPNLNTEAQELAGGNPDGWVIIDFTETYEKMAPALVRAGGWTPEKTFVTGSMRNEEALNQVGEPASEGLQGVAPTSQGAPAREAFDTLFQQETEFTPTGFEGAGFDAVILPFLAALAAGSSDPADFKEQMQAVSGPPGTKVTFEQLDEAIQALLAGEDIDYEGAWGPVDWDGRGDPTSALYDLWQLRDGTIETVETFTFEG